MAVFYRTVVNNYTPDSWTYDNTFKEARRVTLSKISPEFIRVKEKINCNLNVTVSRVERIENPFLWGSYQLKKAEYEARGLLVREEEIFHCTGSQFIPSIIKDNLDWRRFKRTKFGRGASFSPNAKYANKYANFDIGSERALILTKVLVSRTCGGSQSMIIPHRGCDTSTGNGNSVFVKYCDNEFYPEYVAYYRNEEDFRAQRSRSHFTNNTSNITYEDDSDNDYDSDDYDSNDDYDSDNDYEYHNDYDSSHYYSDEYDSEDYY